MRGFRFALAGLLALVVIGLTIAALTMQRSDIDRTQVRHAPVAEQRNGRIAGTLRLDPASARRGERVDVTITNTGARELLDAGFGEFRGLSGSHSGPGEHMQVHDRPPADAASIRPGTGLVLENGLQIPSGLPPGRYLFTRTVYGEAAGPRARRTRGPDYTKELGLTAEVQVLAGG